MTATKTTTTTTAPFSANGALTPIGAGSPSAVATAVHVYRVTSRRVRRIMTTEPTTEARDTANLIRRRDGAWRFLMLVDQSSLARLAINEEAALLRIGARRALGEDTTDLFVHLGQTRADMRRALADLNPTETRA